MIKDKTSVDRYVGNVAELHAALATLTAFVENLPAPDESDELPTLHYGHLGVVSHVVNLMADVTRATEEFYE